VVSTVDGSLHGGDGAVVDECRYDWGTVENLGWQVCHFRIQPFVELYGAV
jgi:hypothetical protein